MGYTLLLLCGFIVLVAAQSVVQEPPATTNTNDGDPAPFLLLGIGHQLYSMPYSWPYTQGEKVLLHSGDIQFFYITGIAYHYRRRMVFWCNSGGEIYSGSFQDSTKLTNLMKREVIGGPLFTRDSIGNIAVDWLNDHLYWTEKAAGKVMELDLETQTTRTVVDTTDIAAYNGLAMYPFPRPHGGWIFWSDAESGQIERIGVSGKNRTLVADDLKSCVWPMEIDYAEQRVYWANTCENTLLSRDIGNSDQSVTRVTINSPLSSMISMSLFEDVLFWNEGRTVKATNKSIDRGEVVNIFSVPPEREAFFVVVEVVHKNKQPEEDTFIEIISPVIPDDLVIETCPYCVNGRCSLPFVCMCHQGWAGDNCTTDVDECATGVSGCDQECHNTAGSYYCSCNSTSMLDDDGRTCLPIEPTTSMVYMVTTTLLLEPEETTPAGPSSIHLSPSPSSSLLLFMTSAPTSQAATPTPHPTMSLSSFPSATSSMAAQTPLTPSQVVTEPEETPTMSTDAISEVESSDMTLIIIVAAAGGGCALLVIVVVVMIIAVIHYARKRCGSYTVNPDPSKESGIPSWVVARTSSPTNHVNGITQVNGVSHITACTSSFKTNTSPTCSTQSFT